MEGECGVFYNDGQQIGGCYSWELDNKFIKILSGDWNRYKLVQAKVKTRSWWMFESMTSFDAEFFIHRNNRLITLGRYKIKGINQLPEFELGKCNGFELEMFLEN